MKKAKKILAIIIVLNIILGLFPGLTLVSYAAPSVSISAETDSDGNVKISWNTVSNTAKATISYHDISSTAPNKLVSKDTTATSTTLTGLKSDYVYDIKVELLDSEGTILSTGYLYLIPSISLYASPRKTETVVTDPSGGKESGTKPKIDLSWNVPKVWVDSPNSGAAAGFYKADNRDALDEIGENIYQSATAVDAINYRINVSTDSTNLDEKASITINNTGSSYESFVGNNISVKSTVGYTADTLSFTLADGLEPKNDTEHILPDTDILPGTVYYMNVKASLAKNSTEVRGLTVMQTGSSIAGSVPYVYTPVRFKLSRDAANNIYVQVYKINQGTLTLPGMYYEVQSNTTNDPNNGWTRKAQINDSYFPNGSAYTVTIISGMNVNSTFYYRVVVRTETSGTNNSLESCALPYTLSADTSRPPIPTNIAVSNKELNVGTVSNGSVQKTTDVTISWDKPSNWNEIKANHTDTNDIYYHLLLNTVQTDTPDESTMLEANGENQGLFSLKYRLVDCFNANLININNNGIFWEDGNRLYYKIDGRKLFKNDQVLYNAGSYTRTTSTLNSEGYPDYLLPNKVYYFQMYTTKGTAKTDPTGVTDKSITSSFTTLSGMELDVPSVEDLKANKHDPNYIEIQFMKNSTLDWKDYTDVQSPNNALYYDIYMSTSTDTNSFIRVGTTQNSALGDVTFTGLDAGSTYIKAGISQFTMQAFINRFGLKVKPNTTYYFLVKTRMHIDGVTTDRESAFTAILPVTTDNGGVQPPDDSAKKPIAPTDFAIASDASGNKLVSGSSVTFRWTKQENNVVYRLICTSGRVAVDAPLSTLQTDPIYQNFQSNFGTILLNPANAKTPSTASSSDKFIYDPVTKTFTYRIDTWLFPNRLYYFTLRSEVVQAGVTQSSSAWVSIPVTTSLITAPDSLQPLSDCQLGFFWTDTGSTLKAEDYIVKLKGPDDTDFKLLSRSQYTVVADGSSFYGRIMNLKPNTSYSVRVFKGAEPSLDMVDEFVGLRTRDANSQIDVKWRGLTVDLYSSYEIAVKTEQATQYTTLDSSDLEIYMNENGRSLPYYLDKTIGTAGTNNSVYYARIKSIPVKQSDGSIVHRPLTSNTKYYIKVRYVRVAPTDATLISYSKYIGPVDTRTEFNQGDYDQNDQDTKNQATFTDKIKELEQNLFWRMNIDNGSTNKLLIKGQRLINLLQNSGSSPYVLDISSIAGSASTDVIYMPFSVTNELDSGNKSLIIKTAASEYTIRPNMVDSQGAGDVNALRSTSGVKDVFIKVVINRTDYAPLALPSGKKTVSKINEFSMQAVGSSMTDKELSDKINDKLYNSQTGLVKQSLDLLANPDNPGNKGTPQQIDSYISSVIQNVENSLSDFLNATVDGTGLGTGITVVSKELTGFKQPVRVKLFYNNDSGLKTPYVLYNGSSTWQKLSNNILSGTNTLSFDVTKTGKYAILATQTSTQDVASDYWAKDYIDRFMSKYDVSDVFAGISTSLNPESDVSVKELVLLYEKVMGKSDENKGLDIKQKAASLGLSGILNTSNTSRQINRQEAAAALVKLYAAKMGLNAETLKPGKNIYIKDDRSIDNAYYKYVVVCVDLGAMSLNAGGYFLPKESVTRAEIIASMVKLLGTTGEM